MVDYTTIEQTLNELNTQYNKSSDLKMQILISKFALLEFCGWIEVTMDDILLEYLLANVSNVDIQESAKKRIENNWGFHFQSNIEPLFCYIIGVVNWQKVVNSLDQINKKEVLVSTLNNFTKKRGTAAHTNTQVTQSYDAPSTIKNNFDNIVVAIKQIQATVTSL